MTSKIPLLLSPYIEPLPPGSLTLLTSVLAASTNWLIIRYLYSVLGGGASPPGIEDEAKVVLVSWLRDWEFWKIEARRAVGLDLAKLQQQGRLAFVDGLTNLFAPPAASATTNPNTPATTSTSHGPSHNRLPARPGPTAAPRQPLPPPKPAPAHTLSNPTLDHLTTTTVAAISTLASSPNATIQPSRILLIFDAPSLLLQTTTPPISATALTSSLLALRAYAHAAVVALPADAPLLAPAAALASRGANSPAATPLERENAAFAVGLAHQARWVLGCRGLATGFAEDVSGVVRVTRGGGCEDNDGGGGEEGEWLYFVGGDGGVRVFGRGEVDGG